MTFRPLAIAMGTLTTVRVPISGEVTRSDLATSTAVYPLVGVAIGVFPSILLWLPAPVSVRAALALTAWIIATGALHLDGWADCCDAALAPDRVGRQAEDLWTWRQGVLKDPHIGTFGVVGLILLLLTKGATLTTVPIYTPIIAAATARYAIVLVIGYYRPAKPTGLVSSFGGETSRVLATVSFLFVLGGAAIYTKQVLAIGVSAIVGIAIALVFARVLSKRFGGITGDVCGATAELAELTTLLVFVPWYA